MDIKCKTKQLRQKENLQGEKLNKDQGGWSNQFNEKVAREEAKEINRPL